MIKNYIRLVHVKQVNGFKILQKVNHGTGHISYLAVRIHQGKCTKNFYKATTLQGLESQVGQVKSKQ